MAEIIVNGKHSIIENRSWLEYRRYIHEEPVQYAIEHFKKTLGDDWFENDGTITQEMFDHFVLELKDIAEFLCKRNTKER